MKTRKVLITGVAVMVAGLMVFGLSNFASGGMRWDCSFAKFMWTNGTRLDSHTGCGTCHTDFTGSTITMMNPLLNAYGLDLQAHKNDPGCEHNVIEGIGQLDSDGDGYNNLYEISALSFPGFSGSNCPPEANGACEPVPNPGDMDYDGVPSIDDCNDYAATAPGMEVCDGIDNNCDGQIDESCSVCTDSDGDMYFAESGCGTVIDCNDSDASINPGAAEACDGVDNNCDGNVDEGCQTCTDADGDGYYVEAGCGTEVDCDDGNPDINPGACDIKRNGIDEDCDGSDRRGGPACSPPGGTDPEVCDDTIDNDGDGDVDCLDADCAGDPSCSGGCVPSPEICDDGVDNDCDGKADCADKKDCRRDPACYTNLRSISDVTSI